MKEIERLGLIEEEGGVVTFEALIIFRKFQDAIASHNVTGRATRCAPGRSRNDFTDGDRRTICPSVPDMFIYIHAHLYLRLFLLFFSLSLSRLSLFHASCLT